MDEVSPSYLRDGVEFQVKLRGYDPVQVDDFLDRVAGGIELLQQQLRQALERAARAEQQASESADADQALRRTLVLAQRAADLATKEADEHAAGVRAEADEHAADVRAEAERRAGEVVMAAEAEALRLAVEAQRELRFDIARLEVARANLEADVDALEHYLEQERARLRRSLTEQIERLDALGDAARLRPLPTLHELKLPPEPQAPEPVAEPPADLVEPEPEPEPESDDVEPDEGVDADVDADVDEVGDDVALEPDVSEPAHAEEAAAEIEPEPHLAEPAIGAEADTGEADAPEVADSAGDGQPDDGERPARSDRDDFLDELRKSLHDDEPLGPRDGHPFDQEDGPTLDLPDRSRWGLRRRR